jgi:capsular polysaccharide biosynthesis protein
MSYKFKTHFSGEGSLLDFKSDINLKIIDDLVGSEEGRSKIIATPHDIVVNSFFGDFYKRAKKNKKMRFVLLSIWRLCSPTLESIHRVRSNSIEAKKAKDRELAKKIHGAEFKLVSQEKYFSDIDKKNCVLFPPLDTKVFDPYFIPERYTKKFASYQSDYNMEAITIAEIEHAYVRGGSNFFFIGSNAIHHNFYDHITELTVEEYNSLHVINSNNMILTLIGDEVLDLELDMAACFLDGCSLNYAHWLVEVLPRITLFCAQEKYKNVPLIIDDGLHENQLESLKAVVSNKRDVYILRKGCRLKVNRLLVTSSTSYVPFGFRNIRKNLQRNQGQFNSHAIEMMRERCITSADSENDGNWPSKIFLIRNSINKQAHNLKDLKTMLAKFGFVTLEAEKLTFFEQVNFFNHADVVIGASGSAMANLIFTKKNTKILILIGNSEMVSYYYWQNMATSIDKKITYILGDVNKEDCEDIHPNFTVPLSLLSKYLESECRN